MFSYVSQWPEKLLGANNFKMSVLRHFEFCDIYVTQKKMQNSWTINIKQNDMSHTSINHDKFRTNKIQNGCQSAVYIFFSLSRKW